MCLYISPHINTAYIRDKQPNFPLRIKINELCLFSEMILHKIILILNYMNMYSFANCHLAWRIQSVTHLRCAPQPWCALVYANLLGLIPTIYVCFSVSYTCGCLNCMDAFLSMHVVHRSYSQQLTTHLCANIYDLLRQRGTNSLRTPDQKSACVVTNSHRMLIDN